MSTSSSCDAIHLESSCMIVECIESAEGTMGNGTMDSGTVTVDSTVDESTSHDKSSVKAKKDTSYSKNDFISRNREVKNQY